MGEYHLWLKKEPTAQQVIDQIGDPKAYSEIVFCGYGEPTIKIDQLVQIAKKIKADGARSGLIPTAMQISIMVGMWCPS